MHPVKRQQKCQICQISSLQRITSHCNTAGPAPGLDTNTTLVHNSSINVSETNDDECIALRSTSTLCVIIPAPIIASSCWQIFKPYTEYTGEEEYPAKENPLSSHWLSDACTPIYWAGFHSIQWPFSPAVSLNELNWLVPWWHLTPYIMKCLHILSIKTVKIV